MVIDYITGIMVAVLERKLSSEVGFYADDGISGTNTKKRDEFNRMIEEVGDEIYRLCEENRSFSWKAPVEMK